jgi:hypothetical protein
MTRLPDIDAIARGEDQPVPESVDLQYGVAAALVRRAVRAAEAAPGDEVLAAILRYARAFPQREMGVMLVSDLQRSIARPLIGVPGFADWAASLDELVLGGREADPSA